MSFLRRLRRDKDSPPTPDESKEALAPEPKQEVADDDVHVYGAEERPKGARPAPRVPAPVTDASKRPPHRPSSPDSSHSVGAPPESSPPENSGETAPSFPSADPPSTSPPPSRATVPPASPSTSFPRPSSEIPPALLSPSVSSPLLPHPSKPPSEVGPPPLPEHGPVHPREVARPPGADSTCFVCGTPLEGRSCSVCRMTWVE